jgi:hypothetical protein
MNPKNANMGISAGRLKPVPLYLEVAELLRQRIFKRSPDDLEPGSWIDELKLSPRIRHQPYTSSRGIEGIGNRRAGHHEGSPWRVCDRSVQNKICPMCTTYLSLLESDAAGVVATNATKVEINQLVNIHESLEKVFTKQPVDTEQFF